MLYDLILQHCTPELKTEIKNLARWEPTVASTLLAIENILCMFSKFLRCMFYRPDWLTLYVLYTLYLFKKMAATTTV